MERLMTILKVKNLMTDYPVLISPEASLKEAALAMRNIDCGFLPVGTKNNLVGVITDRDIVIRAISHGKLPSEANIATYMSTKVFACNEEDELEDAARKMHEHKVSRLVVKDHTGKVTGILSFGGILRHNVNPKEIVAVVQAAAGNLSY
jgi:CBS domain-containing protein